ncbi:unnamed protein product [Cyprideis torosa]|uniref:Uncharacterized protein n=1 Tax=Cyprideis torosa TaxID=163714 RepID=A0A7R8ZLR9_9CRUS|nr:unnamed protein product [Cyprideis torosa]CAG0884287.1 unnamed protein product [Cyprideis torosa]
MEWSVRALRSVRSAEGAVPFQVQFFDDSQTSQFSLSRLEGGFQCLLKLEILNSVMAFTRASGAGGPDPSCCCSVGGRSGLPFPTRSTDWAKYNSDLMNMASGGFGGSFSTRNRDIRQLDLSPEEEACLADRKWWAFLLSSIFTFLAGIIIVLIGRLITYFWCGRRKRGAYSQAEKFSKEQKASMNAAAAQGGQAQQSGGEFEGNFMTEAKDWAGELISGQTTTGRILVVLVFVLSIASLVIYFIDASKNGDMGTGKHGNGVDCEIVDCEIEASEWTLKAKVTSRCQQPLCGSSRAKAEVSSLLLLAAALPYQHSLIFAKKEAASF